LEQSGSCVLFETRRYEYLACPALNRKRLRTVALVCFPDFSNGAVDGGYAQEFQEVGQDALRKARLF